ncbi:MAG TPA: hypothetical protein VF573_27360 [Paraburkholderia sp.]|uniref:hypothetical protein n=1 Tax=Paraburkholderia sp. TaxID=1926495 RepID=UPI002ED617B4
MAIPPNTTPTTATDISVVPYRIQQEVSDAPEGAFVGSCFTHAYNAVWYTYTPPVDVTALGIVVSVDPAVCPDYDPTLSVWTGGTPTQVAEQCFQTSADHSAYVEISVTPGTAYLFQISNSGAGQADPAIFTLSIEAAPRATVPAGSVMVTNDLPFFPTCYMDRSTGAILRVDGFPACECAEWLPDGTLAIVSETALGLANRVEIYDAQLVFQRAIAGVVTSGVSNVVSPLTSNGSDRFYGCDRQGNTVATVSKFTAAGTIEDSWDIVSIGKQAQAIAVSLDETILYISRPKIVSPAQSMAIARWDLVNDIALTNLYTPVDGTYTTQVGRDLVVLGDGSMLWPVKLAGGSQKWQVLRISSAGALTMTYDVFTNVAAGSVIRIRLDPADASTFWAMDWPSGATTGDPERFQQIRLSDGVVVASAENTIKEQASSDAPLYAPSQSCPLLITPVEIPVPSNDVTYHTVPLVEKRVRQAPHITNNLLRTYISECQIHLQAGIGQGTGQGADPQVMFQFSTNGGQTWSNERLLPAGRVGQFTRRCLTWRLGQGRDWVFRVSVTDPNVPWALVAAYLDVEAGTN